MLDMDEGAKRWVFKTARTHFWRVRKHCELEDLMQDGYLHWLRIVRRYGVAANGRVRSRAHLMGIFKIAYHNHLNDLSKKVTKDITLPLADLLKPHHNETEVWDKLMTPEQEQATFRVLLSQAPRPVKELIQLLMTDEGCKKMRAVYRVRPDGSRQTLDERLRRLVRANRTVRSVPELFKAHFQG